MYCVVDVKQVEPKEGEASVQWENCQEQIDLAALSLKEPILFYDEVDSLIDTNAKTFIFVFCHILRRPFDVLILFYFRWFCMKMNWLTMECHF